MDIGYNIAITIVYLLNTVAQSQIEKLFLFLPNVFYTVFKTF